MAKHCETFEHPADLGLEARADTLAELFEAFGDGLAGQVCRPGTVRATATRPIETRAEDTESLLVDFLSELLRLLNLEHFLVASVRVLCCDGTSLSAEADGEDYDPARHELDAEIKAVTYHQLKVARQAGQWVGRVILDV